MKDAFFAAAAAVVFLALLALISGRQAPAAGSPAQGAQTAEISAEASEAVSGAETEPDRAADFDAAFSLQIQTAAGIRVMDLHTYLTGVLLAEMPADFETEALKAQAVACRTYALRCDAHGKHGEAALCTDSRCCQGWRDPETVPPEDRARAEAAVSATDGLVILYEGRLIDATFFSCSGGRTEAAAAVWGSDLPYLQAVDSPGEEAAAHFTDRVRLPLSDFCAALQAADPAVRFPEAVGGWVGAVETTAGDGVASMEIGGRLFTGTELRKLFSLRSTAFTLTLTGEEAVFETRGYGHRVGLSQYGANAMALEGSGFEQILTHYYQGVEIGPVPD